MSKKVKIPKIPALLDRKIYKTGQTRGADDDVIYQNRVGRNSTVLIPYAYFDQCKNSPDDKGVFEKGYIVLINPEQYFEDSTFVNELKDKGIILGKNGLLFYETREQWNNYNPAKKRLKFATSRTSPLGGKYVARVPSTTSKTDEKILRGYTTSGLKGAGIRIYEYASLVTIKKCRVQLEYIFWKCSDANEVMIAAGMTKEDIETRIIANIEKAEELNLADKSKLLSARIINKKKIAICPLCLKPLSANGFINRLKQSHGRDVPDLTVTQINLFHIDELKTGEYNHRPYNLGWGHHHCNVVVKDSGIEDTIKWMKSVLDRNEENGFKVD